MTDRTDTPEDLRSAFNLLMDLLPPEDVAVFSLRHSPATVYTTLCTLLILTLQRFGGGQSLQQVVREVVGQYAHVFPDNKRVREGSLSNNPSAFSKARGKLSVQQAEHFCDRVAKAIIEQQRPLLQSPPIYVVDGTSIALSPTSELTEVYPPSTNQFGQTVWPIMMLTVAHELTSGAALRPEFGAKFGSDPTSEAEQIETLAKRIPPGAILLADSNYGIFRVCYRCHFQAQQEVLFRLTNARFKAMRREAKLIACEDGLEHSQLDWKPSPKDRMNNPDLPQDSMIPVHLYSGKLTSGEPVHLVSSMNLQPQSAMELYSLRYSAIEHDIRDLKVTLNLEQMRAQSAAMVQKEVLCSMVAYNLIIQFRRAAAAQANLKPRRISFKRCYDTVRCYLLNFGAHPLEDWLARYEQAVMVASKDVIPLRPGRAFPRKAYPKRPKSTNSQRRKKNGTNSTPPTAEPPGG